MTNSSRSGDRQSSHGDLHGSGIGTSGEFDVQRKLVCSSANDCEPPIDMFLVMMEHTDASKS